MRFELHHEKDTNPVFRWAINKILDIFSKIEAKLYPYADMYTAVWDDDEDDDPINDDQMVIF